jgi:hypothetical protein
MPSYLDDLPRIDFSVFTEPLDQLVLTVSNKLDREWPTQIEAHSASPMVLRMLVSVSNNTYRTIRYICADVPPDPSRKLEYSVSAQPLARTILDALFTIVFLSEELTERTAWFMRAGWRELHEKLTRMRDQYGADPQWTSYLAEFGAMVTSERQRWGVSDAEAANPRSVIYWPTPAKMISAASLDETKQYLQYLNDWFYRELSQDSHLSWPGLWRRGAYFLFEKPTDNQRAILNKVRSDVVSTAVILLVGILSEIELIVRFGLTTRLRYMWGLTNPLMEDAREIFEMRYANQL